MSTTTTDASALRRVLERLVAGVHADLTRARSDYAFALHVLAGLAGLAALGQTVGTALSRMGYPFTLEWMEGGIVDHVRVVLAGKPLYREPSFAWTPFIYPPFYYWVCAAFMKVLGVSLFTARLVSVVSMVGCFGLIGAFVRREVGGLAAPLVGAGLFAITFKLTGFWLDLARVDSLFFALFLGGAYLTRFGTSPVAAAGSGLLLFLAFFTKQTGLVLALPVMLGGLGLDRRRGLITGGVFALLAVGAVQWMDLSSGGWFRYYVFEVASQHPSDWPSWHLHLMKTLWEPMPLALGLALLAVAGGALRGRAVLAFYVGVLLATWGHGFTGLLHDGGFANALIPCCGVLAILAGIGAGWIAKQLVDVRRLKAVGAGVVLVQFLALAYDQRVAVPRRRDVTSGRLMIERWRRLRDTRGEIYSPAFGYYGMLAGSEEITAHAMALSDIFKTGDPARVNPLSDDVFRSLRQRRYPTLIHDGSFSLLLSEIEVVARGSYRASGHVFEPGEEDRAWPRTGFHCRPDEVWSAP